MSEEALVQHRWTARLRRGSGVADMFRKDSLVISHSNVISHSKRRAEAHRLLNGVAFMFYSVDGHRKLALNCWAGFLGPEDSEFCGGAEVSARIWGLRIDEEQFYRTKWRREFDKVSLEQDEAKEVSACFFNGEFFAVAKLRFESLREGRFRAWLLAQDVTGRTDEPMTEISIDGRLREQPSDMEYPQW